MLIVDISGFSRHMRLIEQRAESIPWDRIGKIGVNSIKLNFDRGGRPIRWKRRKDKKRHPILKKTGRLRDGNFFRREPVGVSFHNKVPYQAVQNFGYPKRNIPAREYQVMQKRDISSYKKIIKKHLTS